MVLLHADGTAQLSLTENQFIEISQIIEGIYTQIHCPTVAFAHESGLLIANHGTTDRKKVTLMCAVAAANYSATLEMARLIGEAEGFDGHYNEGCKRSSYVCGVGEGFFILTIFSRETTFGMVRVLTSRAIRQLLPILEQLNQSPADERTLSSEDKGKAVVTGEFCDELSGRLEKLLTAPGKGGER